MKSKKISSNGVEYTVFEDGRIINSKGKELKWSYNRDGYPHVTLFGKYTLVHRLVATLFVPNPHGYTVVDHVDSDRGNPHASNLEWVTPAENNRRAAKKGAYRGINNPNAKLTEDDVFAIKLMHKIGGLNARQISTVFPVSQRSIEYIIKGVKWKHITI